MSRNIFDPDEALAHQQVKTRKKRTTRADKVDEGRTPTPKQHEIERIEDKIKQFTPTPSQKTFINKIRSNTLTVVDAHAGVGKTAACLWYFTQEYLNNPQLNIMVVRTPVELGDDKIGFLPDSASSKIAPHFESTKAILEQFLGKSKVVADLEKRIHFTIPNFILGKTIDNTLILIDECQTISSGVMKLLLERVGKNTKVVVAGCSQQMYTNDKKRNGLNDLIGRFFNKEDEDYVSKFNDTAIHQFTIDDVQRSDFVKTVIKAYM